jgi:small subunit ribosomal protein S18
LPKGTVFDYKDISLLQKFVSDRGKMFSRRVTGVSAKDQRQISHCVKIARYLGLLTVLGAK